MSTIALRQRTSTEIVDAAFQVYRREPGQFIVAAALIYVPWMLFQVLLGVQGDPTIKPSVGVALAAAIGSIIVYAFVGGVTTVLASDVYLGKPTDVARAFRTVGGRLGPLIGAMFLSSLLIGIGFVLLIIPGVYAAARFFCVQQAVLLEHASPDVAFSRSSMLSMNLKRHILNTLLLVGLLVAALAFGEALLSGIFSNTIIQLTLTTIWSAILYPFFGITGTLLYYDTRIRREGFDVEYLATLSPAGAGPTPAASV